jgi:protein-S-isoprenylcysteine O-methyltransferase Ste14
MTMIIGAICVVTGFGLRIYAKKALKSDWSLDIKVPHFVKMNGLYKFIRHPAYTGALFVILGLGLINPVLGIMILAYTFYVNKVIQEEKLLQMHFPEYADYRLKTGMFLPFIRVYKHFAPLRFPNLKSNEGGRPKGEEI